MPYLLSCDIHTHTMFSAHAYSTIEENVYWAAERGLQVLGSADHLSSMHQIEQRMLVIERIADNIEQLPVLFQPGYLAAHLERRAGASRRRGRYRFAGRKLVWRGHSCFAQYCRRFVQSPAFAVRFGDAQFGLFGGKRA